jgi:hypothetical protein
MGSRGRASELCVAAEGPRGTLVGGRSLRGTGCSVDCELAEGRCLTGATRWSSYPPRRCDGRTSTGRREARVHGRRVARMGHRLPDSTTLNQCKSFELA